MTESGDETIASAPARTALALSGGGLFGAYQVGVWKALSRVMTPDVVVGTSVGSLNGWAMAGGATPDELEDLWMGLGDAYQHRWRMPRNFLEGCLDDTHVYRHIAHVHERYQPRVPFGAVVTDTRRLRLRLFRDREITSWRHLAASCAVLGILSQQKIDDVVYSDGGLFGALPLWAGEMMGATRVIGINVWPPLPGLLRTGLRAFSRRCRPERVESPRSERVVLSPSEPLGNWRAAMDWNRDRIRRWIHLGESDAERELVPLFRTSTAQAA